MPKDNDFLKKIYEDLQEEMRYRRNFESQLTYFFLFYIIVGIAVISLFEVITDHGTYLVASISISVLILVTTMILTYRIVREQRIYSGIGKNVQKIWMYFDMFENGAYLKEGSILPRKLIDPQHGYGQSKGYFYTGVLLWIAAVVLLLMLISLLFMK